MKNAYEEVLHIYLFTPNQQGHEQIDIDHQYTAGLYSSPQVTDASQLTFTFYGDIRYQITVTNRASFRFNHWLRADGIRYQSPFRHKYLTAMRSSE